MMLRVAAATLALTLMLAPPAVLGQPATPVPASPPPAPSADSLARQARADSLARFYLAHPESLPLRTPADSTRVRRAETLVRVPAGQSPLAPPPPAPAPADTASTGAGPESRGPEQRVFLTAGITFPLAPPYLTNGWNPGGSFGGGLQFLLEPRFSVLFSGEWSVLPFDKRRFLRNVQRYGTGLEVEGGGANLVLAAIVARFNTRGTWPRVYAGAGPGLGMVRYSEALLFDPVTAEVYAAEGETVFKGGMTAGAGVEFVRQDGSGVFVDVHWSAIFTRGDAVQYLPLRVGLVFP